MKEESKTQSLVRVPAVYRNASGDLVLAIEVVNEDTVEYIARDDSSCFIEASMSAARFDDLFSLRNPDLYPPVYLALNLLGRASEGTAVVSAQVKRRLAAMLSKEELMKLSERALGKEYSRVTGKQVTKIPTDPEKRGKYIDEMLAKITEEPAAEAAPDAQPQSQGDAAEQSSPPAEGDSVSKEKQKTKSKRKKSSEPKQTTIAKSDRANPYREGSDKHKAFEIYKAGGEREAVEKAISKLGVTKSTVNTWMYFFRRVVKEGKQPDWKEKRSPKKAAS